MIKKGVWICALLALAACSDDDGSDGDSSGGGDGAGATPAGDAGKSLRVVSYNVGLFRGYVDYAGRRVQPVSEAIAALEGADVLCLQELWDDADIAELRSGLEQSYPHIFLRRTTLEEVSTPEPDMGDAGAADAGGGMVEGCGPEEAQPLADCAGPACEGVEDLATCVLGMCGAEFSSLSTPCSTCAVQNLGLGDVDDILEACVAGEAPEYLSDGHNGLLLVSKKPIENQDSVTFDSFLTVRSALYGEIDGLPVACTHLTANVQTPYDGKFDSYGAENAYQVDELIAYVEGKTSGGTAVIAGDFNNGPEVSGILAALSENYARFEEAGYVDANAKAETPICTWCGDNSLISGSPDLLLDHVIVRGAEASDPERLFDQDITLPAVGDDPEVTTKLSDHYGIAVTVRWSE